VEQQYHPAPGASLAQAARTVLPGEPFDPPAASQVPGPRSLPAGETGAYGSAQPDAQQYEAPEGEIPVSFVAPGTPLEPSAYGMPQAAPVFAPSPTYEPPGYAPPAAFQTPYSQEPASTIQPVEALLPPAAPAPAAAPGPEAGYEPPVPPSFTPLPALGVQLDHDFEALQQFVSPQGPQAYVGPAGDVPPASPLIPAPMVPAPSFPAPAAGAEPVGPAGTDAPQSPMALDAEGDGAGHGADGAEDKASGKRRGPSRALVALLAVVVVAGGGYFGYTQLHKSSSSSDTSASSPAPAPKPAAPVAPTTVAYGYPSNVGGFPLQGGPAARMQAKQLKAFAAKQFPAFGATTSVASYSSGKPAIVAVTYHPARTKLASTYSPLLDNVRKPSKGNTVGAFKAVAPGAAGGKMTCGGQSGASPIAYCVFQGRSVTGMVYTTGSPKSALAEIVTREMRAYAEH
jgi:hypothetical protein